MSYAQILHDVRAAVKLKRPPRVLFFGMQGNFSLPPLHALLARGIEVSAIVIPVSPTPGTGSLAIARREPPRRMRSVLPVLNSTNIVQLAWQEHIPLWEVAHISDPATLSTLVAYQPDVICVACFSQRIPRTILDLPRFGCLNVHPSLLPAKRGPDPLFWTFRHGDRQTGVTIHLMDDGMDTGDILAQEVLDVPDGISYPELELHCATHGGQLLAQTVWQLYEGEAVPQKQEEAKSSYYPLPDAQDYVVPVLEWSAQHVYNFICGVAQSHGFVTLHVKEERIQVSHAVSYRHETMGSTIDAAYCWRSEELWVRCQEGWVGVLNPTIYR